MDFFILDRAIFNFFTTMDSQKMFVSLLAVLMGVYLYHGAINTGADKK